MFTPRLAPHPSPATAHLFRETPVVEFPVWEVEAIQALRLSGRDPEGRAFVPLADAHRQWRDFDRALDVLREGLLRVPDLSSAHVVAAWTHEDRGDLAAAEAAWTRVLDLDAGNAGAIERLGRLLQAAGRTEEAEQLRGRLRALEGETPFAPVTGVEDSPDEAPEHDAAPAVVEGGTALLPSTRTLAELFARQGYRDRAIEVYVRLAAERPGDPGLRARLEELRLEGGAPSAGGSFRRAGSAERSRVGAQAARTIGEYLRGLLEWSGEGRVTAGAHVARGLVVPIESLAPTPPVSVESLAPGPAPVAGAWAPS